MAAWKQPYFDGLYKFIPSVQNWAWFTITIALLTYMQFLVSNPGFATRYSVTPENIEKYSITVAVVVFLFLRAAFTNYLF